MKLFRSSPSVFVAPLVAIAVAITSTHALVHKRMPIPMPMPLSRIKTTNTPVSFLASITTKRNRIQPTATATALASSRQEDIEDQISSLTNSWNKNENNIYRSDIPSDSNADSNSNINSNSNSNSYINTTLQRFKNLKDRYWKLPPFPEDQFIMTGDIFILFIYAFSSHSINDAIVKGLLDDPKVTIPEAVRELDPLHDMVQLQTPVWVDIAASNPNVPFGNPSVDHALEVSARESLLNHWGPLLSTEGSACVALCLCWLVAGWIHRSFQFDATTYCGSDKALTKTVETWITAALLLAWCAAGTDALVGHSPVLQNVFCLSCHQGDAAAVVLTQSDLLFIVDSLTVLIAWRWSAHQILNTFR